MSEASKAMVLAGEYRSEGYDPSTALSMAWDDIRGENPDDGLIESVTNPVSRLFGGSKLFGLFAIGYVVWAVAKKSWTPWKPAVAGRALPVLASAKGTAVAVTNSGEAGAAVNAIREHRSMVNAEHITARSPSESIGTVKVIAPPQSRADEIIAMIDV